MGLAAAAPIIGGAVSAGSSAAGGKKGNSVAKQQLALQQDQLNFGKQLVNTGMTAWQPAKDYWSALLQGGPAATTAVGPYAAQLRQQGTGAARAIATLPAGGERNLAAGQNINSTYSQIRRLTEGVQPTAASALASMAGVPISAGTSATGQAVSLAPSLLGNAQNTKAANAQGASGLGSLLYNAINKPKSTPAFPNMTPGNISGSFGGPTTVPISIAGSPWSIPMVGTGGW